MKNQKKKKFVNQVNDSSTYQDMSLSSMLNFHGDGLSSSNKNLDGFIVGHRLDGMTIHLFCQDSKYFLINLILTDFILHNTEKPMWQDINDNSKLWLNCFTTSASMNISHGKKIYTNHLAKVGLWEKKFASCLMSFVTNSTIST